MTESNEHIEQKALTMPSWLKVVSGISSWLNRIAAVAAAILLTMMVCLILTEIVLRFFSRSTFMTDVLVGHGVAAVTFLALGWTLEQGSMIRIMVVTRRLSKPLQTGAEVFSILTAGTLVIWLMFFEWRTVARLWSRGTTSEHYLPIPLWIPEAIFFVGLTLLALQLFVRLLKLVVLGHDAQQTLKL